MEHNKCYGLVFDIIKKYASENKPINQTEILRKITRDPENVCDRKTVSRAITRLIAQYGKDEDGDWINENTHLHYNVILRGDSSIPKDFWFEFEEDDDGFSDAELIFLMDAVQFSKHVDKTSAEKITKKLLNLSHNKYSAMFELYKNVNEKNVPVNKDLFEYLGKINNAIHQQKMISFYPTEIGTDKKAHRVGVVPVKTCPYRVVVADGCYYLLCGEKNSKVIRRYRVDRISGLSILDETFTHSVARINAAVHSNEYIAEHCYMNIGETVDVILEIDRKILGDVIDTFGTKIKIDPAHPEINRITVHVKSSEKDIIDWAMRYGEYAVVLEPDYLREEIRERATLLRGAYSDRNSDIEYLHEIERAKRHKALYLSNIDLNGQDSYKDLEGIRRAVFRRNGIRNFSFLYMYPEMTELTISHNELSTPEAISPLENLRHLTLESTGITNLDFLRGNRRLVRLSISELSLENVDAIYELSGLRHLTVNEPVAKLIDKRRLEQVFGNDLEYAVEDKARMLHHPFWKPGIPKGESWFMRRNAEAMEAFETRELTDLSVRTALASKVNTGVGLYSKNKKFNIVDSSCFGYERVDVVESFSEFTGDEYSWYVTFDGPASEQITDADEDRIFTISVFKRDNGCKLVCMAARNHHIIDRRDPMSETNREKTFHAIHAHIHYLLTNHIGWAELSGELERYFSNVATINDVINPAMLVNHKVYKDIKILNDNYHYSRTPAGEKKSVKIIAYGYLE